MQISPQTSSESPASTGATSPPNNEPNAVDFGMASDAHLTFYEKMTTVTGQKVLAKNCKPGDSRFLFEKTTKIVETQVETTASVPGVMILDKGKRVSPIFRPFAAHRTNDGSTPEQRFQIIKRFFPGEGTSTNAMAGPSRKRHQPSRNKTGDSYMEPIIISDTERDTEGKIVIREAVVIDSEDDSDKEGESQPISHADGPQNSANA